MAISPCDYNLVVKQLVAESTKSTKPSSFSSPAPTLTGPGRRLFRRQITWRFLNTVLFCSLLVLLLHVFHKKGHLSVTEKRAFNTLTLLFSAVVSLSLGSLLTLLGCMLRWRWLAWEPHKPREVGSTGFL
jgi:hypothetical protein